MVAIFYDGKVSIELLAIKKYQQLLIRAYPILGMPAIYWQALRHIASSSARVSSAEIRAFSYCM